MDRSKIDDAEAPDPREKAEAYTAAGAPTDAAHEAVGDGVLTGSVPAGLSPDEMKKVAEDDEAVDSGTS